MLARPGRISTREMLSPLPDRNARRTSQRSVVRDAGTSSWITASSDHTIRNPARCTRRKKCRSLEPV